MAGCASGSCSCACAARGRVPRACGADVALACHHLAVELSKGSAAEQSRARTFYEKGCKLGRQQGVRGRRGAREVTHRERVAACQVIR